MTLEKIFKFESTPVRVAGTEQAPLFCAADVCLVLDINNSRQAVANLENDEKITVTNADGNPRDGVPHTQTYVTESGLYHLIFKSRKDEAKRFRRWVTEEVIPEIRRTGAYLHASQVDPFVSIQAMIWKRESMVDEILKIDETLKSTWKALNDGTFHAPPAPPTPIIPLDRQTGRSRRMYAEDGKTPICPNCLTAIGPKVAPTRIFCSRRCKTAASWNRVNQEGYCPPPRRLGFYSRRPQEAVSTSM